LGENSAKKESTSSLFVKKKMLKALWHLKFLRSWTGAGGGQEELQRIIETS